MTRQRGNDDDRTITAGYELFAAARRYGERQALIAADRTLPYRELEERSNALANGLATRGVSSGALVITWLPRGIELVESFLGLEKLGAVRVAIEHTEPPSKVVQVANGLNAACVFVLDRSVAAIAHHLRPGRLAVVCGDEDPAQACATADG
ncbi:MAG: AMP-binding protein [Betaproteobacteria bacterium]|nr:AMP-binding protein [Betaproteobacteria bacterium]